MSFNELNCVEHFIIQKLSGRNLNAADPMSSMVMQDPPDYGSFPWQYRSAAELNRPSDQVLLAGELREALIRINPEIATKRTAESGDDASTRQNKLGFKEFIPYFPH